MKLLLLGLMLLGAVIFAQPRARHLDINELQRQTLLIDDSPRAPRPFGGVPFWAGSYSADTEKLDGNITRLTGHVRITTASFTLTADTVELRKSTREILPAGNVRIRMTAK